MKPETPEKSMVLSTFFNLKNGKIHLDME